MRKYTGSRSYPNGIALTEGLRVKIASSTLALAGAGDRSIGTAERLTLATETKAAIIGRQIDGTVSMVASGAISAYTDVYGAASGKITSTPGGEYMGLALEAASGDGSIIEVLQREAPANYSVTEAHTADDTLTAAESGSTHTTYGASGTVVFSLPAAVLGMWFRFVVGAAQELRIDPNGTETISLPSTGVAGAAGKYLTANAAGESVVLFCASAGTWAVAGFTGTWTAEP